jgi:hypothetical protein
MSTSSSHLEDEHLRSYQGVTFTNASSQGHRAYLARTFGPEAEAEYQALSLRKLTVDELLGRGTVISNPGTGDTRDDVVIQRLHRYDSGFDADPVHHQQHGITPAQAALLYNDIDDELHTLYASQSLINNAKTQCPDPSCPDPTDRSTHRRQDSTIKESVSLGSISSPAAPNDNNTTD